MQLQLSASSARLATVPALSRPATSARQVMGFARCIFVHQIRRAFSIVVRRASAVGLNAYHHSHPWEVYDLSRRLESFMLWQSWPWFWFGSDEVSWSRAQECVRRASVMLSAPLDSASESLFGDYTMGIVGVGVYFPPINFPVPAVHAPKGSEQQVDEGSSLGPKDASTV